MIPLAAVVAAAAAGGATWALAGGDTSGAETDGGATGAGMATARVERSDLVQRETVSGTLGYSDTRTLAAAGAGTVTALRAEGSTVRRGQALYWVDGKPVTLMYGAVPMWRPLDASSADGRDIRELEWNLVALGYDPRRDIDIDGEWDWATTAAVKRWQDDRGLEETGAVSLGQIVFQPGPRRVGQLKTTVGALVQPGTEIMDTSSLRRVVTFDLDATKQTLAEKGDDVQVELPDGSTVGGQVVSVAKVATAATDDQGQPSDPTVEVDIELARGAKTGALDQAPVGVGLTKEEKKGVLTLPVSALLALAEGGYAVEVVDNGTSRLVAVDPGLSADGRVEIAGDGIDEGTSVVVPE